MINIKTGNITSSNFAIGDNNNVIVNKTNDIQLNQADIDLIKEELEIVKKNLKQETTIYKEVNDIIEASNINEKSLIQKIKQHAAVFTSSVVVNIISSGVYDLIKNIINSK